MTEPAPNSPWWGDYALTVNQTAKWEIGPLRIWIHRSRLEWRLTYEWVDELDPKGWSHGESDWPEGDCAIQRFVLGETTDGVHLRPLPPNRSVIARPKTSLCVLPGQRARVFVSSPLWVEIAAGTEAVGLCELPTKRLSETWFGTNTRSGELSYAIKTSARTDLAEMPRAQYRLLTPIVIENQASDLLDVERLSLPVPYLTIYRASDGDAWSNEIHMLRTEDGGMAALDVRQGPPPEAKGATALSTPREVARQGQLFRAFGSLLGFD
jgi:hypothetical protein